MPGDRLFFLRRKAGENQFKLVMRQGLRGADRVLVDPEQLARTTGTPLWDLADTACGPTSCPALLTGADGRRVRHPELAFCTMDHIVDTLPGRNDDTRSFRKSGSTCRPGPNTAQRPANCASPHNSH